MVMDSTVSSSEEENNIVAAAAAAAATAIYNDDVPNDDNNNTTHDNNNNNNNLHAEEEEENITQQRSSKELAIQTLLQILEANNIEIDDELRRRALGLQQQHLEGGEGDDDINEQLSTTLSSLISPAPRSSTSNNNNNSHHHHHLNRRVSLANRRKLTKRESIFGALFRKHHSDILHSDQRSAIEREITEEFTERFGQFSEFYTEQLSFECRIVDGSYVVETPVLLDGDEEELEEEEFFDNEENQQQQQPDVETMANGKEGNNDDNNNNNNNKKTRRRSSIQQQQHQLQRQKSHIPTVTNTSTLSTLLSSIKRCITTGTCRRPYETKVIMKDINLVFEEGKMYLILGAPGCGKSTLLKMIAGRLPETSGGGSGSGKGPRRTVGGKVEVNGVNSKDTNIVWSNIVSYVDQIERLHGYLTVKETIEFAWNCRWGGTHAGPFWPKNNPEADELMIKLDKEKPIWMVDLIMRAVGIKRVQDTYVGNERVRGVSGGEKKRVSVAEMLAAKAWVECNDEISTGLDAATTYDISKILGETTRLRHTVRIVSLLQPSPEVVALFDELILMGEGRILYAGPVDEVTRHFKSLGYEQPDRMDPVDWLQSLPTKEGAKYLKDPNMVHLTNEEFAQKFTESERGIEIRRKLQEPTTGTPLDKYSFNKKYHNPPWRSIKLLITRELLLWWRDKTKRIARIIQCLLMGIIVGTVFWQSENPQTRMGVNFQSIFFISLGAMLKVPPQIDTRAVFYKEQDANFYPTWTFVLARALAVVPASLQDTLIYGSIVYWFSGYVPLAANYFVYLLLLLLCAFTCNVMFSVFSAKIKDRPAALAAMSVTVVILILFSGFTVQPNVIPSYYIWIYWINLFAWIFRAVVINEYRSPPYDQIAELDGTTEGEAIMQRFGFTFQGEPYDYVWVWYTVLFCIGICIFSILMTVRALETTRFESSGSSGVEVDEDEDLSQTSNNVMTHSQAASLEIKGATLTFKNINYTVKASTTNDELHLLKDISGYFSAGKLTALMGSSGAGKTTLMDVLSLRKTSGKITGDVRVNGHTQEADSFRRMSGYVEQFDVQSPQLTVRETVEFSTKMRLDESIPIETKLKFSEQIMHMLELNSIGDLLVGNETGGLSFEQKKRLSIAVELASNPSIIFLDEPTSGLDSRAASIVMKSLRRIADSGIGVVCTIHQPSVAIFNSFDSLLLLKRGGETVFFGDLGFESSNLITYLEGFPSTTPIKAGENAATWMLTTIGAGSSSAGGAESFDYADAYAISYLARSCISNISLMNEAFALRESSKITYSKKYPTSSKFQLVEVFKRLLKIYWRSPGYNRVRLLVSGIVALLFGSVFASQRVPENEGDMNSRVTSIYITTLFLGVNAMNTVLPVFEVERNMFYRHKASLMYDYRAIGLAFTLVEVPFIILASMVFVILWYFTVGFAVNAGKFFLYFLFMFLSLAVFTFLGQGFMAIFPDSQTAQGFGSLLIGMSGIFGGILIRPQYIPTFWLWGYWTFPLHYVLEGLFTSQFQGDNTTIVASYGSPFFDAVCPGIGPDDPIPTNCTGTAEEWINVSFGGLWVPQNIPYDIVYLCGAIVVARIMVLYGLMKKNYLAS